MSHPGSTAVIRYTLDGSDPTSASTAYNDVDVPISSSLTLKARAFEPGLDSSIVVAVQFILAAKGAVTYPASGAAFSVGQTVVVGFKSFDNSAFNAAYLWLSVNDGLSFTNITTTKYFVDSSSISWTIPPTLEENSLANTDALLQVWQYAGIPIAGVSIHISGESGVREWLAPPTAGLHVRQLTGIPGAPVFEVSLPGVFRLRLVDANGRRLAEAAGMNAALLHCPAGIRQGCCLLLIETDNRFFSQRVIVGR